MDITSILAIQEERSRVALTDSERIVVSDFFAQRIAEANALNESRAIPNGSIEAVSADTGLREDICIPFKDTKSLLSLFPDSDGRYVRVPRAL